MIDGIIFDKDGTLFDFQATWTAPFMALLDELAEGASYDRAAEALDFDVAARRFRPESLVIAGTTGEVADHLEAVLGIPRMDILIALNRIGGSATQVPAVDLVPVLSGLGAERALGLVTNDSEAPARSHLAEAGVIELFDFIAGYDSGFGAKPGPGQLLAFANATGCDPARTLMVGDSAHDLLAGAAAGMIPVGVLTGVATRDDLAGMAEVVLLDIGHLEAWIASLD